MREGTLTTRVLTRALLARQRLLVRSPRRLTETLEQVGGLQTQYAPSGYVGLWSRSEALELDDLTRALERRRVIQATSMRPTIHNGLRSRLLAVRAVAEEAAGLVRFMEPDAASYAVRTA